MSIVLAAMAASAVVFGGARIEGTTDELVTRYETECPAAADCGLIRDELELRLYGDLRTLYRMGEEVDRQTLRTAAGASFPPLALLALRWMQSKPVDGDEVAAAAALDNSSASVRSAALVMLGDHLPPKAKRLREWILNEPYSQDDTLIPDTVPDADMLGFKPYPGARLERLASNRKRAFYTTPDPPDKVIGIVGRGRKVLGAEEFHERVSESIVPPDMDALQAALEKMLAETDPEKLAAMQKDMEKLMQPQSSEVDVLTSLGPAMSRVGARVIILREAPAQSPGAQPLAKRVAAVFRDDALGATVIFVPLE